MDWNYLGLAAQKEMRVVMRVVMKVEVRVCGGYPERREADTAAF